MYILFMEEIGGNKLKEKLLQVSLVLVTVLYYYTLKEIHNKQT